MSLLSELQSASSALRRAARHRPPAVQVALLLDAARLDDVSRRVLSPEGRSALAAARASHPGTGVDSESWDPVRA